MKAMKALFLGALAAAVALAPVASARTAEVEKSDNLKHIAQFKWDGGAELAREGRYVYASESNGDSGAHRGAKPKDGGVHIIDVKKMKEVGFLHCPGTDNDVEAVRPGLIALAFSSNMCAPTAGAGFMLIDVRNPAKPRVLSSLNTTKSHTFKPYPGGKYLYMAGGNLVGSASRRPVIVDVSNPLKPKIAAQPQLVMDCHDISFSFVEEDRKLGFCAGAVGTGEVQIWDASDPLDPAVIGEIFNPMIQYSHYAVANHDGTILAIDDEAFAAHECVTGHSPTGRVWFYDITTPQAPIPIGSRQAPRGGGPGVGTYTGWVPSWCLSHGLDWHPKKNDIAVTWFTGGVSVLHMEGPSVLPEEVAYFRADDSATYSALWHEEGYLFTNDSARGADVFKIKGL